MSIEIEVEDDQRIVGRVLVARVVTADGEIHDEIRTDDGGDGELDLPTAVGMLAIGQHTMLCEGHDDRDT